MSSQIRQSLLALLCIALLASCGPGTRNPVREFLISVEPNGFPGLCAINSSGDFKPCGDVILAAGPHEIRLGTLATIGFSVDGSGVVLPDQNYDGVSASGGDKILTFLTVPVQIDPGGYEGVWSISRVLDKATGAPENKGVQTVSLVPTSVQNASGSVGAQYLLSIGDEGSNEVINLAPDTPLTFGAGVSETDAMYSLAPNSVAFRNVTVSVIEETETGVPWQIRQVTQPSSAAYTELVLVPSVSYYMVVKGEPEEFKRPRSCKLGDGITLEFPGNPNGGDLAYNVACLGYGGGLFRTGRIYHTQAGVGNNVRILERDGSLIDELSHPDLEGPDSLAFDYKDNHLLVTDRNDGEVFVFNSLGKMIDRFGEKGAKTTQIAVSSNGLRFVKTITRTGPVILVFDSSNSPLGPLTPGCNCGGESPLLAFDQYLYIDSAADRKGVFYQYDSNPLSYIGELGDGAKNPVEVPASIAVTSQGQFLVAGSVNSATGPDVEIHLFKKDGSYVDQIAYIGRGQPYIAVDHNDQIWVQREIGFKQELIRLTLDGKEDAVIKSGSGFLRGILVHR